MEPAGDLLQQQAFDRLSRIAAHMTAPGPSCQTHEASVAAQPTSANVHRGATVCIVGAAGGIGQPLSLLMKLSPYVASLHLYDVVNTPGVATDVSHINTRAQVKGFVGKEQLAQALQGCSLVIIPAGVPRKPGMTRDDLFNVNASIVQSIVEQIAETCPSAFINIISNPVNSTVPIAAEVLKRRGVYDPRRLFGVTTLDVIRANTFVAAAKGLDPVAVDVPVVGGHAGATIYPLLSHTNPRLDFAPHVAKELRLRIQDAGTEVVKAKAGTGSATLSMAAAAARFAEACLRALHGEPNVVECAYVQSELMDVPFFASKVRIGRNGVDKYLPLGNITEEERQGIQAMLPELRESIEKGISFVRSK